jgi:hypothetical protein
MTAAAALNRALITIASQGLRTHCSDPATHNYWAIGCLARRCITKVIRHSASEEPSLGTDMSDHGSHEVNTNSEENADSEFESMRAGSGPASQPDDASGAQAKTPKSKTMTIVAALASIFGLLLIIENIWIATGALSETNRVPDPRAAVFLSSHYFPTAARDPIAALNEWGNARFSRTPYGPWLRQLPKVVCACAGDTRQLRDRGEGR